MKLYIVTREENQYDQYGEYFVAAFTKKPTKEQLTNLGVDHYERKDLENTWYNLRTIEEGDIL